MDAAQIGTSGGPSLIERSNLSRQLLILHVD